MWEPYCEEVADCLLGSMCSPNIIVSISVSVGFLAPNQFLSFGLFRELGVRSVFRDTQKSAFEEARPRVVG